MNIVITMGGLGSRFRKKGYTVPKYMIEAKGKTLFDWSIQSLKGFNDLADNYIFIVKKDNEVDVKGFIKEHCELLRISKYHIIEIDYLTDGQATTAMLAKKFWVPENSLLIYNIDTFVEPFAMEPSVIKGDGFIPCFKADGDHWSFVKLDGNGKVVEIKEKVRISDNCTIGAYFFKSCELYETLYNDFYVKENNSVNGEKYVAPLYDYLLRKGGEIYISDINPDLVHVLGTPEELEDFIDGRKS